MNVVQRNTAGALSKVVALVGKVRVTMMSSGGSRAVCFVEATSRAMCTVVTRQTWREEQNCLGEEKNG